jgi:hypothetical protein
MDLFFLVLTAGVLLFTGIYTLNRTFFTGQARLLGLLFVTAGLAAVPVSLLQALANMPLERWGYFGLPSVFLSVLVTCLLNESGILFSLFCFAQGSARFVRSGYGIIYGATAALGYFLLNSTDTLIRFRAYCGLPDAFGLDLFRGGAYLFAQLIFSALLGSYLGRARSFPGKRWNYIWRGLLYSSLLQTCFLYSSVFNAVGPALLSLITALAMLTGSLRRMNLDDGKKDSLKAMEEKHQEVLPAWTAFNNGLILLMFLGLFFSLIFMRPLRIEEIAPLDLRLAIPAGWVKSQAGPAEGVIFSPSEQGEETARLIIVRTMSAQNISLINRSEQAFAAEVKNIAGFRNLNFGFRRIGPRNAVEREYSWESAGGKTMRAKVVYLLNERNFYIIRAEAGSSRFEEQSPLLNLICKSARFTR